MVCSLGESLIHHIKQMTVFDFQGTQNADNIQTFWLHQANPQFMNFRVFGGAGDDTLTSNINRRNGVDYLDGGDGDDRMGGSASNTDSASMIF